MSKPSWSRELINIFCTAALTIVGTFGLQRCAFQDQAELRKQEATIQLRKERLNLLRPEIESIKALIKQIDADVKTIVPVILEAGGAHSPASAEQEKVIERAMSNLNKVGEQALLFPRSLMTVIFRAKNNYESILNRRLQATLTVPHKLEEKFEELRRFEEQLDFATEEYISNGFGHSNED